MSITPGQWQAIEWTRHARTSVVVDDPSAVTGKRVIAECDTEDDALAVAALPDMVSALREAEAALSMTAKDPVGDFVPSDTLALRVVRAALAKAGAES